MFPNNVSLGPISNFNLGNFVRDALENGGGISGGNVADVIRDALENGGGISGGNIADLIGGALGGGYHALHAQFPQGRQQV